ncbi:hypothetical protein [Dinghuibacter silviterrae]|uniref:Uncharacterized protein n=1 Tax=Dinghuibacter silviterrae TaxID=1539049 RepID=A0A4R8DTZ7_9BACT|nr:hypothetical protein [Dinghuibacter silviterrae]TDX01810.1 hypothetical protein EDB95_2853 [Dinghuibacter silviterrae]
MGTIPKFLSCDNFMEDEDGEYVLHTEAPRFLAKWNEEEEGFDIVAEFEDITAHFNGDEDKITGLFEEMATWYSEYDEWLDQDVEE